MTTDRPLFDPDRIAAPDEGESAPRTMSVTQLNALIKRVLEDHLPGTIHLVGEISNFSRPSSGHLYLTLKDQRSEIRTVMWRSAAEVLKFQPADGMEVIATGYIDVYEPRGQYQFYIRKLEPRGIGALELAFRQLRDRLAKEGLFDPERKKSIPQFPQRIAVVTSPTGAAIRDIIKTLRRRYPCASIVLHPARVQGEGAAEEIAEAINRINQMTESLGGIDTMIVGRGGGSLEDLWAFNEEIVARAIHTSTIPVISGVGHEVDITIADLVADLRAPTPTAAAELAVPVFDEVLELLSGQEMHLARAIRHQTDLARSRLDTVQHAEWFRDPVVMIHRKEQQIDELSARLQLTAWQRIKEAHRRLHQVEIVLARIQPDIYLQHQRSRVEHNSHRARRAMLQYLQTIRHNIERTRHQLSAVSPKHRLNIETEKLNQAEQNLHRNTIHRLHNTTQNIESLAARLEATSYRRTLARGYSITRSSKGRKIVTSPEQVSAGQKIITETKEGDFESRVLDSNQGELFEIKWNNVFI